MKRRAFVAGIMLLLAAVVTTAEEITLNFKDTDLQTVTEMVSKITGKNFIIDPRVKGNVTVISSAPLDADSLYSIFLSILRVHGFVAVDGSGSSTVKPPVRTLPATPSSGWKTSIARPPRALSSFGSTTSRLMHPTSRRKSSSSPLETTGYFPKDPSSKRSVEITAVST